MTSHWPVWWGIRVRAPSLLFVFGGFFTDTRGCCCCCCCFLTRTVSSHSWSFSSLESIWPPANQLCNVHVWLCRSLGWAVSWRGCAEPSGAQSPVLWHFKASSVSLLFQPLGVTHLWQCYITHNVPKAPAAPGRQTAHSRFVLLSSATMEAPQRPAGCFHAPRSVIVEGLPVEHL